MWLWARVERNADLRQQIVKGTLGNKTYAEGSFGMVMLATKVGRVALTVSVVRHNGNPLDQQLRWVLPLRDPADLKGVPTYKARMMPIAAQAKSGTYLVTIMETWDLGWGRSSGLDLRKGAVPKGSLPLDQAALQRIVDQPGWTVRP